MSACDHVLGISISRVLDDDGNQRIEWKDEVKASRVDWRGDGIVNTWWTGTKYKFCPNCGIEIGDLSPGLRAS